MHKLTFKKASNASRNKREDASQDCVDKVGNHMSRIHLDMCLLPSPCIIIANGINSPLWEN